MSSKTLTILAGVFILLIALVGLQFWGPAAFTPEESTYKAAVKSVNADNIDTITIAKQSQSIGLKRESGVWKIDGKAAAKDAVDQLFTQFINDPQAQEIAQTNTRHKELEITDELATTIQFSDTLTVLAGKSAADGLYTRVKGNDAVYLLRNATSSMTSTVAADWYDKTIVKLEESAMTRLTVVKTNERFAIIKENETWKIEDGKQEVDRSTIGSLFSTLSSFQAATLADEKTAATYSSVSMLAVTIEHTGGKDTLEFFKGSTDYLVKRSSDNERFIVPELTAKRFLINQADIVKKEPTVTQKPS